MSFGAPEKQDRQGARKQGGGQTAKKKEKKKETAASICQHNVMTVRKREQRPDFLLLYIFWGYCNISATSFQSFLLFCFKNRRFLLRYQNRPQPRRRITLYTSC